MMKSVWTDIDLDFVGADLDLQFDNFLDDIARDTDSQLCSFSDDQQLTDDNESIPSTETTAPPNVSSITPNSWQNSTLYILNTDAEDEELNRAQKAYDKVVAAKESADARAQLPPIPKIMKNDIRRYFSRMFMNTINSADFRNIQSYFHTFMAGPCKFVMAHETLPDLRIPDRMVTAGPRLMSHYLLGCFVQYPDMVISMKSSNIVTSSSWAGTKIVMEMEIRSTKMYDLEQDEWIPQIAELGAKYSEAQAVKAAAEAQAAKKRRKAAALRVAAADLSLEPVALDSASTDCTPSVASSRSDSLDLSVSDASVGIVSDRVVELPAAPAVSPPVPTGAKKATGKGSKAKTEGKATKSKAAPGNNKKRGSEDLESCDTSESGALAPDAALKDEAALQIPEAYVHALVAKAKLLPQPIELVLGGTITMFLDETNHMQHMSMDMRQTNR